MAEKIELGKYVELVYDVAVQEAGEEVVKYSYTAEECDAFIFGFDHGMIDEFVQNINGLEEGERFDFYLSESAFGDVDPQMIILLNKDVFNVDGKFDSENIYPGAEVPMRRSDGLAMYGTVKEVTADGVVLDFNHPFAGKRAHYIGVVQTVRPATEDELEAVKPKGGCGGCGGCGGGGCDSGSCGGCGGCQ